MRSVGETEIVGDPADWNMLESRIGKLLARRLQARPPNMAGERRAVLLKELLKPALG
ncbi:hypothetical protein SS37A_06180 [Methylocystis iwaonis]|uniref:Uncharacterized protein n=1 Tax=Methylocystis iwaonis TaxID=2885079 RepID=A0ABN6VBJ9_9HYPH|nr:hypothetical protein SS37A_06180 [Methylocystis iwaonis]